MRKANNMDQPKIERLLQLVKLLCGNTDYTVEEIARLMDVSPRTVYRYIDTFKSAGFVLRRVQGNVHKMVVMPSETIALENVVYFSKEEAYIINSLIDNLSPNNALRESLKAKLSAIYDQTSIAEFIDNKNNSVNIEKLRAAIKEKRQVVLQDYASGNSQTIRDRLVEPISFIVDFMDICAYDLEASRNKVFKIARIGGVKILDKHWTEESKHHPLEMDVFRMSGRKGTRVRLEMTIKAHNLLIEEYPLAKKDIKQKGDLFLLDTKVYSFLGVGRFYFGLMPEIRIIDSPEFEEYVKNYLRENVSSLI